jgi:hypothetical protein
MDITYTGGTGNTYFVKFTQPISVLSNRDYDVNLSLYVDGMFNADYLNKVTILMYSDDVDVNIVNDTEYVYPFTAGYISKQQGHGPHPFPDDQEYEWSVNGIIYNGVTGYPVYAPNTDVVEYNSGSYGITGLEKWIPIKSTFRTPDNTGQQFVELGILIETTGELITGGTIFVNDFVYTAADNLEKDPRKKDLTIEQNFDNNSFFGGIQKLRIYDKAFTSQEILHNALIEAKDNPNIVVSKGGRIIYR